MVWLGRNCRWVLLGLPVLITKWLALPCATNILFLIILSRILLLIVLSRKERGRVLKCILRPGLTLTALSHQIYGYVSSSASLNTTFNPGSDGHSFVSLSLAQIAQTRTISKGHSLRSCYFLHLWKNIAKVCSSFTFFCLACNTSNCVVRVLKIYVLKFSRRLPTLAHVTPLLMILLFLVRDVHIPDLVRVLPHENLIHNRTMSS